MTDSMELIVYVKTNAQQPSVVMVNCINVVVTESHIPLGLYFIYIKYK